MYRIKERFMWTGMYKDVEQLVRLYLMFHHDVCIGNDV